MLLIVSASAATSPLALTVSSCLRSPLATAVTTFTMPRTCSVRFAAITLTLSVRSFHVPATPGTCACPPSLPSVPTSRATRVTSAAKALSWSTIVLIVFFSSRISPFTSTVILRDKSPRATAVVTSAILRTCAVKFPAIAFTESVRSFHLSAKTPFRAHLAGHPRHFCCKRAQLLDHGVESFFELQNLAAHVHGDFFRQVTGSDRGGNLRNIANLARQVAGHEVNVVGQVFPRAGNPGDLRLSAELAFRTNFAGHACDLAGEGIELVHHRVDGILQLQDFALHIHRDFARQIAARHGGCYLGDVAHLRGQI